MKTNKFYGIITVLTILFFTSIPLSANDIKLRWQANVEPDLKGYNIYCGTQSRSYDPPIPIGNATEYLFTNLQAGKAYFVAVTAVDNVGNESGYSSEITITIPESDSATIETPVMAPIHDITLSANAYKSKGDKFANLTWSGASSEYVDVYRDGNLIPDAAGIINDGEYLHGPFNSGKPATYQICEKGTSTCSNELDVSW
jgi:hypothetical protein